jgi:hypothetical protein
MPGSLSWRTWLGNALLEETTRRPSRAVILDAVVCFSSDCCPVERKVVCGHLSMRMFLAEHPLLCLPALLRHLYRSPSIASRLFDATGIHPGIFDVICSGLIQAKPEYI